MAGSDTDAKIPGKAPVDETPISPVQPLGQRRRSSLEHHLQYRPERGDLVESCVCLGASPFVLSVHVADGV